jgi:predicted O-linked N-acetylglucosamine transferase (SPINDLY family)
MPICYQPNGQGAAPAPGTTREQEGLARDSLVFCSFNQPVKITPAVFARWCELLRAVPGAVLWLLDVDARANANLRREASQRGVDPARLVFAPRTAIARHAARIGLADLALDTFPYGSHTTASDAIRAGVPLVTTRGETFASRVAASVLSAAGCREWVFDDAQRAFDATLAMARDPGLRAAARRRAQAAADSALFDSRAYVRDFELLLMGVVDEAPGWFAGPPPAGVE